MVREDRIATLGATRSVLRAGRSEVELLEPNGLGRVAQHLARSPSAVFAVGLAVRDLEACRGVLDESGIHHEVAGNQVWISGEWMGIPGLRVVLSQDAAHEPVGLLSRFYEATHLIRTASRAAERLAAVLGLDPAHFVPIESERYGYCGTLTRFGADVLDRVEIVTPVDEGKAMGRYFARRGPGLYMVYAECEQMGALRARLEEYVPEGWVGERREGASPDNLFVSPGALDGTLLGVSGSGVAWRWSGHPERAPASGDDREER